MQLHCSPAKIKAVHKLLLLPIVLNHEHTMRTAEQHCCQDDDRVSIAEKHTDHRKFW